MPSVVLGQEISIGPFVQSFIGILESSLTYLYHHSNSIICDSFEG
jgi:hypothetical protein